MITIAKQLFNDEECMQRVKSMMESYPDQIFIPDRHYDWVFEKGRELNASVIPCVPAFCLYDTKSKAFRDRDKRMVKYATACFCYSMVGSIGPLMVALAMKEKHPDRLLDISVKKADGEWMKIGMKGLKEANEWRL